MKKLVKLIGIITLTAVIGILFAACGGGDGEDDGEIDPALNGFWVGSNDQAYEFNNGNFKGYNTNAGQVTGTYRTSDGVITLRNQSGSESGSYYFRGDDLIIGYITYKRGVIDPNLVGTWENNTQENVYAMATSFTFNNDGSGEYYYGSFMYSAENGRIRSFTSSYYSWEYSISGDTLRLTDSWGTYIYTKQTIDDDDGDDNMHVHSYSTSWSNNTTQHWHECSCGDKIDIANHIGDPCTVCGYENNLTSKWWTWHSTVASNGFNSTAIVSIIPTADDKGCDVTVTGTVNNTNYNWASQVVYDYTATIGKTYKVTWKWKSFNSSYNNVTIRYAQQKDYQNDSAYQLGTNTTKLTIPISEETKEYTFTMPDNCNMIFTFMVGESIGSFQIRDFKIEEIQ